MKLFPSSDSSFLHYMSSGLILFIWIWHLCLCRVDGLRNCLEVPLPSRTAQVGKFFCYFVFYPLSHRRFCLFYVIFSLDMFKLPKLLLVCIQNYSAEIDKDVCVRTHFCDRDLIISTFAGLQIKSNFTNLSCSAVWRKLGWWNTKTKANFGCSFITATMLLKSLPVETFFDGWVPWSQSLSANQKTRAIFANASMYQRGMTTN